jgi:hypothetical protein
MGNLDRSPINCYPSNLPTQPQTSSIIKAREPGIRVPSKQERVSGVCFRVAKRLPIRSENSTHYRLRDPLRYAEHAYQSMILLAGSNFSRIAVAVPSQVIAR